MNQLAATPREAKARGQTRYFTGKPCRHGHIAERRVSDTHCVKCSNATVQAWKKANKDRFATYMRGNHILRRYGLTLEQEDQLRQTQSGKCAICCDPIPGPAAHIDHDHDTKKVRGLLCGGCNKGLGHFKDRADLLAAALKYLSRSA